MGSIVETLKAGRWYLIALGILLLIGGVFYIAWHMKPDGHSDEYVEKRVSVAIDSTRAAVAEKYRDSIQVRMVFKRIITQDGKPPQVILDSLEYFRNEASDWSAAYNYLLSSSKTDTIIQTDTARTHQKKQAPFGLAGMVGPSFEGLKISGASADVLVRYRSMFICPGGTWHEAKIKPTTWKTAVGFGF